MRAIRNCIIIIQIKSNRRTNYGIAPASITTQFRLSIYIAIYGHEFKWPNTYKSYDDNAQAQAHCTIDIEQTEMKKKSKRKL